MRGFEIGSTDSVISNTGKVQDVAAGNDQNTGWYYKETTPTGGDQPHNNLQPYVVVQWIVKM